MELARLLSEVNPGSRGSRNRFHQSATEMKRIRKCFLRRFSRSLRLACGGIPDLNGSGDMVASPLTSHAITIRRCRRSTIPATSSRTDTFPKALRVPEIPRRQRLVRRPSLEQLAEKDAAFRKTLDALLPEIS